MIKFFRRFFWLSNSFVKKYHRLILSSLVASLLFGTAISKIVGRIPTQVPEIRLGIVGQYTSQSLPPLVKNILSSGLTKLTSNQVVVENLASWEIRDEGKKYIFTLRPDLVWSNGKPVKPKDVVINIPDVDVGYGEENQIIFNLPQSFSPFPSVLTNPIINKDGLTASPFQVSLTQNTNGLLTKIRLTSKTQAITIRIFSSTNQAITAFKLGEIDAVYRYPKVDNLNLTPYGKVRQTKDNRQALAIFFNNQDPVLKDKSVRQGIAYALKDKSFGNERALGPISSSSWAYNPLVKPYDYDSVKATTLIRGALSDKNQILNLELATIPQYLSIAENIKKQLDSDLINLNIKVVSGHPDLYQLYLALFDTGNDPDQYVFWHSSHAANNISKTSDEKLDKDLEDGRRTQDQNERKKIYNNFQRTFAEELPVLFLFYPSYSNLSHKETTFDLINPDLAL